VGEGGAGANAGDRLNAVPKGVCVVIPTYNRRDLLDETLRGVAALTGGVGAVLVIDNASTDGTAGMVAQHHPFVHVLRCEVNHGSAGGFGEGLRWAVQHGYEWVWLLDDDSIPEPTALDELLRTLARFPPGHQPVVLATKVIWTDGSILPLNAPLFKRKHLPSFYFAAENGALSIRAAPYAGVLVHRSAVEDYGIPIPEYFLWNDDLEWTGRILRSKFGVLVPTSVICHKTPGNPSTTANSGERFYFEIRNKLWMCRRSEAYARSERARFLATLAVDTIRFLRVTRPRRLAARTVIVGLWAGAVRPAPAPAHL